MLKKNTQKKGLIEETEKEILKLSKDLKSKLNRFEIHAKNRSALEDKLVEVEKYLNLYNELESKNNQLFSENKKL